MVPTNRRGAGGCSTALAGLLCLMVCDDSYLARRDGITLGVGNAAAHNIAVQTGTPWSRHSGDTRIDVDGERLAIAAERYRSNRTIAPKGLATQELIRLLPQGQ